MTTRRAESGAPLSQERYMSSPEFAELRGISGSAATAKASILSSHRQRSLIYFLQALSLETGGLPKVVEQLLKQFPERIGSETMHRAGMRPGQAYSGKVLEAVQRETNSGDWYEEDFRWGSVGRTEHKGETSTAHFIDVCKAMARAELPNFLIDVCVNPTIEIKVPGEPGDGGRSEFLRMHSELSADQFGTAQVGFFRDIIGALFEMQRTYAAAGVDGVAQTEITRLVGQTLGDALRHPDRIYVVEGREGIGKSKAAEAWCKSNPGMARYVKLSGATNKTAIFRAIARALGLAASYTRTATEMQARVEGMLQQSKLMLVIDEAHYLLAQGERVYSRPEMLDWVYTSLANFNVPSALLCTPIFAKRVTMAEKQTVWNSRQFRRRCRYRLLPDALSLGDLQSVAAVMMPECGKREAKRVVDYAICTDWPLTSVVGLVEDARDIAQEGRVQLGDIERAIRDSRIPADSDQVEAFQRASGKGRSRVARPLKEVCIGSEDAPARALKPENFEVGKTASRANLTSVDSASLLDA
jgi:AAA domain